jgi:hypothetical protein
MCCDRVLNVLQRSSLRRKYTTAAYTDSPSLSTKQAPTTQLRRDINIEAPCATPEELKSGLTVVTWSQVDTENHQIETELTQSADDQQWHAER